MTNLEIIEAVRRFEESHPVEDYRFFDWNVWPLIREETAIFAMMPPAAQQEGASSWRARLRDQLETRRGLRPLARCLGGLRSAQEKWQTERTWAGDRQRLSQLDPQGNDSHLSPDRDVVILTISGRRLPSEHGLYEIYADPLVECLERQGVSSLVWERGEPRFPRCRPSAWISGLLEREARLVSGVPALEEPIWWGDFAAFSDAIGGRYRNWHQVQADIVYLQKLSLVFEQWLRRTGAKLLVSVCWYGLDVMAATLAARRLGILTADLQHGLHGAEHHGYASWAKVPSVPYQIVPDVFWCWGIQQARRLMEQSPAFAGQCRAIPAGNLWLNKWRYDERSGFDLGREQIARQSAGYQKTILVTLQNPGEFTELMLQAISQSPAQWFWLLRFHPATSAAERSYFEAKLRSLECPNCEYELSGSMAPYALMQLCDLQVTGYSTCAQEALFFGLPTITVTRDGASALAEFIRAGSMLAAQDVAEIFRAVEQCKGISARQCRDSVQDYFASRQVSEKGLQQLLALAGIGVQGGRGA
jgi:hypothetical protein